MKLKIPSVDDSRYPVRLGPDPRYSILRGPSITYDLWGIEGPEEVLRPLNRKQYTAEWEGGGDEQMKMVGDAAKASLGDCPGMLYETNKKVMLTIVRYWLDITDRVRITEPGFGKSTVNMYKHLLENNIDPDKILITGIEPSQRRIDSAASELKGLGLKENKHFVTHTGTDIQHLPHVEDQHVVVYIGTKHHDAYQDTGIQLSEHSLLPGGFLVDGDWFERMCMYPSLVLRFYQGLDAEEFGWETKEDDLEAFERTFPNTDYVPELSNEAWMAVEMIGTFWESWARVRREKIQKGRFNPSDDYYLQEAHGYPKWYTDEMERAGLVVNSPDIYGIIKEARLNGNPHRITTKETMLEMGMGRLYHEIPEEGSELLTTILAQKPVK
jgi:hypothetical protein